MSTSLGRINWCFHLRSHLLHLLRHTHQRNAQPHLHHLDQRSPYLHRSHGINNNPSPCQSHHHHPRLRRLYHCLYSRPPFLHPHPHKRYFSLHCLINSTAIIIFILLIGSLNPNINDVTGSKTNPVSTSDPNSLQINFSLNTSLKSSPDFHAMLVVGSPDTLISFITTNTLHMVIAHIAKVYFIKQTIDTFDKFKNLIQHVNFPFFNSLIRALSREKSMASTCNVYHFQQAPFDNTHSSIDIHYSQAIGVPDDSVPPITGLKTTLSWVSNNIQTFFPKTRVIAITVGNMILFDNIGNSNSIITNSDNIAAVRSSLHSYPISPSTHDSLFIDTYHSGNIYTSFTTFTFSSSLVQPDLTVFNLFHLSENLLRAVFHPFQNPKPIPIINVLSSLSHRFPFAFSDMDFSKYNYTFLISIPAEYNLSFANCVPESTVSMVFRNEMFNPSNGCGVVHEHLQKSRLQKYIIGFATATASKLYLQDVLLSWSNIFYTSIIMEVQQEFIRAYYNSKVKEYSVCDYVNQCLNCIKSKYDTTHRTTNDPHHDLEDKVGFAGVDNDTDITPMRAQGTVTAHATATIRP